MKPFFATSLFFALCLLAEGAEIGLRTQPIRCENLLVTLGDIAIVQGAPGENLASLRETVLLQAPQPGEQRVLDMVELRNLFSRVGISSVAHRISGAKSITLIGESVPSSPIVSAKSAQALPSRKNISVKLIKTLELQLAESIAVYLNHCMTSDPTAPAELPWTVSLKLNQDQARALATGGEIEDIIGGKSPLTGHQHFQVIMTNLNPETGENVTVSVEADVTLPQQVVVVRRTLSKGHIITESDLMLDCVDQLDEKDYFVDSSKLIGLEVVSTVRERSVLTGAMIKKPTWVRKGDLITIRALNNGIVVRANGVAQSDGCQGDTISVMRIDPTVNTRGKRNKQDAGTCLARVSEPKTVEILAMPISVY